MNNETNKSWWHTLPGVLTAAGGVITAIATLITALYQAGYFSSESGSAIISGEEITTNPKPAYPKTTEPKTIEEYLNQ